ncbi:hypothetical protein HYZ98_01740 [Candidatus Peregrinibacteria bacterium]|nr:hypothetical protein [Candidatus Peregrinibacteria bacterium]
MTMDNETKINAVIHKVDELDHRIDGLEAHDKKSWVFSRNILKRGFGIIWDILFFLLVLSVIGGIGFLGFIGLSTLIPGIS